VEIGKEGGVRKHRKLTPLRSVGGEKGASKHVFSKVGGREKYEFKNRKEKREGKTTGNILFGCTQKSSLILNGEK